MLLLVFKLFHQACHASDDSYDFESLFGVSPLVNDSGV
jgi:hypothetical protein